jgi:CheY-like chemotaxis protein
MALRILIVEDDSLVREMATEALVEAGFDVIEAVTGEEAVDYCGRQVADVLFTDIRLPGIINGWDIAERCRNANPRLRVIYTTGFSSSQPRPVPGSTLIHKPYTPEELVRAIRAAGCPAAL